MEARHRAALDRMIEIPDRPSRSADDRVLSGVCGGLGRALGVDPNVVRLALAVLTIANGSGVVLYLVALVLMPHVDPVIDDTDRPDPSGEKAIGVAMVTVALLILFGRLGLLLPGEIVWASAVAAVGIALVWTRTEASDRTKGLVLRSAGGGLLVVAGLGGLLAAGGALSWAGQLGLAVLAAAAGVAVLLGPLIMRLFRDLSRERRERIRSEERSEMAAHLHDSVLQTLALIQRADSPGRARTLARRQERELRAWLFGERPPDDMNGSGDLAAALDRMVTEVEDRYEIEVAVVLVGSCPLEPRVEALVSAIREAVSNAARHAEVEEVSVYVEVETDRIEAYVRDRGVGFDPAEVGSGRLGIKESIVGRMARHGGRAEIHSEPGGGTEIVLEVRRTPLREEAAT